MSKNESFWVKAGKSLGHVYWIGGATTAGKSTISKRLAHDFGMEHYSFDSQAPDHRSRATEDEYPALYSRGKQGMAGFTKVLLRPPEKIAELQRDLYRERLRMVVEDLLAQRDDRPVVADVYFGETLDELRQMTIPEKVIFLVPTMEFHRSEYQRRFRRNWKPFFRQALEDSPDPEAAFMLGWAQYQMNYNRYIREECRKRNLQLLITGGHSSVEETYRAVCSHFGLSRSPE